MLMFIINSFFMFGYITGGNTFPQPLTAEEEEECIKALENGDNNAKNILIERNLRLVAHIVKKYFNYNKETEDLISIGTIGLIKAVNTFKAGKGSRIATYASRCIENEILMYLRSCKKRQNDIYLQDTVGTDKDGNEVTLQDKIADCETDICEKIETKMQINEMLDKMDKVLTERENEILRLRYGIETGEEVTQKEIAAMLGISRSYVSRIEKKALHKMSKAMEEE